jgi:hypothetical protein
LVLAKVSVLARVRVRMKVKVSVLARVKPSESMLAKGLGSQELGSQELVQKAGEYFPARSP